MICFIHERLTSLFIVCQTMFTIYGWIATTFLGNKKGTVNTRTFHWTSGRKSSPWKIYYRNSTSARTATWNPAPETKKKTSAYIDRLLKAQTNHSWCRKQWSVLFCYLFNVEVVDRKSNALSYEYSITPTEWQHFSYYLLLEIYTSTTETRGRYVTVKTKEAVVYFLISHLLLTNRQDKKWND